MPTLEEMTGWSVLEIEAAIRSSLPPEVRFECGFDREAGVWFVRFWQEREGQKVVLFQEWGIEQRLTYFNGYGWLWARQKPPPPKHSPWKPRQHEVLPQIRVGKTRTPDPEDLNPDEIKAVYDAFREHPKKR